MCDRVREVGLAETRATTDEQRIIARTTSPGRGDGGGVRELVRGPDDEVRERVLGVDGVTDALGAAARR